MPETQKVPAETEVTAELSDIDKRGLYTIMGELWERVDGVLYKVTNQSKHDEE